MDANPNQIHRKSKIFDFTNSTPINMKFFLLTLLPLVTFSQEIQEKRQLISIHDLTSGETISPQANLRFSQVKTSATAGKRLSHSFSLISHSQNICFLLKCHTFRKSIHSFTQRSYTHFRYTSFRVRKTSSDFFFFEILVTFVLKPTIHQHRWLRRRRIHGEDHVFR